MTAQEIIDKIHELKKETPDADTVIMPYSFFQTLLSEFYDTDGNELPPNMCDLGLRLIHLSDKSCIDIYLHKSGTFEKTA